MQPIRPYIKALFRNIKSPLINDTSFFLASFMCIVPSTINQMVILYDDIELDWLFLQYVFLSVSISYILTTIVYFLENVNV